LIAYVDASAFIKLVIEEPYSDDVQRIWSRARLVVSSRLLYPEARAALAAAARGGRLGPHGLSPARARLDHLWKDVAYVEVTPTLAARAGDLAEEHALRGYDAVHLSSALEIGAPDAVLVTSDGRLAGAAQALGLTTARLPAQSSAG
jgi:predicted nucleic acid-binding protein